MEELRKARGAIKSKLTRFATFLEQFHEREPTEREITEITIRRSKIEDTEKEFEAIQQQIDEIDDSTAEADRTQFESTYYSLLSRADRLTQPPITRQTSDPEATVGNNAVDVNSQVKLPIIKLPTFKGAYDQWLIFRDSFKSLIHNNDTLSKVQKFLYLRSSLEGVALQVIHSLETSAENYLIAWELLERRFENKKLIVHNHLKALFDATTLQKENHIQLRQFLDNIHRNIRALHSLGLPTDHWDTVLVFMATNKLDAASRREWESKIACTPELPTFQEFADFLTQRCNFLESLDKGSNTTTINHNSYKGTPYQKPKQSYTITTAQSCPVCNGAHYIFRCTEFLNLSVADRITKVNACKICTNCLKSTTHTNKDCKYGVCRSCKQKHNSLLHSQNTQNQVSNVQATCVAVGSVNNYTQPNTSECINMQASCAAAMPNDFKPEQVLLSTALVDILDHSGNPVQSRVLLDSGSQGNFITKAMAQKLNIPTTKASIPVCGINGSRLQGNHLINITVKSRCNAFKSKISCIVLNKLTDQLPHYSFSLSTIKIPNNISLADPSFNISRNIDLLIGVELFWDLMCIGQIRIKDEHQICLQKTKLGWVVSGRMLVPPIKNYPKISCNLAIESLDAALTRFWEQEECNHKPKLTTEEQLCETHFLTTHNRNKDGRFVVRLPFKSEQISTLGSTRHIAEQRLIFLQRRLTKGTEVKKLYVDFLSEYIALGHMKKIAPKDDEPHFYFPHHGVIKLDSTTTKLRVVFDGSVKSSSGRSLNDILLVGPTLQNSLFHIILRFRFHQYVVTADIQKMYRQILVDERDQPFQQILWQDNPDQKPDTFALQTVTYGTASAPYLAIRCLRQLAIEHQDKYPRGAKAILRDFYVDDLLSGANTTEELLEISEEVNKILNNGCFKLSKWASNDPHIIYSKTSDRLLVKQLTEKSDNINKTLGLIWNCQTDQLQYSMTKLRLHKNITKRNILSTIAQIYDPLGLLAPVVITAKLLMQQLWSLHIQWDESVPTAVHTQWNDFQSQLATLNNIPIPRKVIPLQNPTEIQLHGFCDSSEAAYGACLYIRTTYATHHAVTLLCAKSRVAPLKKVTLPRLELNGAVLLAHLASTVTKSLDLPIQKTYYWTDSTIVLAWIKSSSNTWKTYVANRVGEIHEHTEISGWGHVNTHENPADLVSRGISPSKLRDCRLWFNGPSWLAENVTTWPNSAITIEPPEIPERRQQKLSISVTLVTDFDLFTRWSSFRKLIRIVAYCRRFLFNACHKLKNETNRTGALTAVELQETVTNLTKVVQMHAFTQELKDLRKHQAVSRKSKLRCLSPFLDNEQIIRVGGRLRQSELSYHQKHQIILPSNHPFTKLLIQHTHEKQLHAGVQGTIAAIRENYWPLCIRTAVRNILHKCIKCFRINPTKIQHKMGDLPHYRITENRPFGNTGVDYCGPFQIVEGRRKRQISKAYVAIFVCLAVKAVHMEVVSNLTSEAFISAFKRFIARRGNPSNMYSDNATNFTGSNTELKELHKHFSNETFRNACIDASAERGIQWHFIPARSPHFGGIWEAAVKSFKHHFYRVVGQSKLTYEELNTLCAQIESILNSRPITPMSEDPNDLSYLTPNHFLLGGPCFGIPEPNLDHLPSNRLSRWQRVEQFKQSMWKRWHKEYLNELQQRTKWSTDGVNNVKVGDLVLLKEDNQPPLRWPVGRITELHPGADNIIRVVSVKVASGVVKRAIKKVSVFPISE